MIVCPFFNKNDPIQALPPFLTKVLRLQPWRF